jgi:hypothetical protein
MYSSACCVGQDFYSAGFCYFQSSKSSSMAGEIDKITKEIEELGK